MRKKTQNNFFDNVLWHLIYLLPIFCMLLVTFKAGAFTTLLNSVSACGLGILADNPIYSVLSQIFGENGIMPLFLNSDILIYLSYLVSVFIVRILIDFILFIPKLCKKWLNSLYGGND